MFKRLALFAAALTLTACASRPPPPVIAEGYGGYDGVVIDPAPLPFDPAPLPPNTAPGHCVARTAGGWLRVPCAADYALTDDRAESWSERRTAYRAEYRSDYGPGYAPGYGPGYGYQPYYRAAGRDADGYLVWPDKTPR